jgi:hypothetical protein
LIQCMFAALGIESLKQAKDSKGSSLNRQYSD